MNREILIIAVLVAFVLQSIVNMIFVSKIDKIEDYVMKKENNDHDANMG